MLVVVVVAKKHTLHTVFTLYTRSHLRPFPVTSWALGKKGHLKRWIRRFSHGWDGFRRRYWGQLFDSVYGKKMVITGTECRQTEQTRTSVHVPSTSTSCKQVLFDNKLGLRELCFLIKFTGKGGPCVDARLTDIDPKNLSYFG